MNISVREEKMVSTATAEAPQSGRALNPAAEAAANHIEARGLNKTFGSFKALEDIDFTIKNQEFVSVLGPSGCGKSTLLRIVAGLIPYESGSATIKGEAVRAPRPDVGVVFQTNNMLPWLTVRRNVELGARIRNMPADARDAAVDKILDVLSLTKFADAHPHQLSGGMRQRASIGQALVLDPQILLMDEPFGALDALTRDKLNVELLRIWQESRKTVMLITHSIAEAVFLSDRVLVMADRPGKIVEEVTIDLPRPRNAATTRAMPKFGEYVAYLGKVMGVAS
ncbi:ABC transporter ATP-binding protein [Ensifer adhaerens]|uniref:ABC transporter ATP-binding protein n=1 Tax=Ensifer adhaerens TaxID=106592 RepID=UPI001F17488B|nr:ABC transporter ATP-binding protein [Ensifer adhaerens]